MPGKWWVGAVSTFCPELRGGGASGSGCAGLESVEQSLGRSGILRQMKIRLKLAKGLRAALDNNKLSKMSHQNNLEAHP